MYIAYGNPQRTAAGSKGSTKLHMDMADALNIMTYVADQSDGGEGCAAWDIFCAADSDKLRDFIREKFRDLIQIQDPIHSQQVYLDDDSRLELWEEKGVKSYRVYQHAGEAVFIPAGCAHQVSANYLRLNLR
jgi:lysine-specific demethylase 3